MTEKRFTIADYPTDIVDNQTGEKYACSSYSTHMEIICDLLNALHEENMNNRAEITRFKLIVSDIVDDLEKQAKNEEPIVISMDYVDWIKSELDLKLNGLKR